MKVKAVVFAYHNVGVRCLKVLLAHGVDVALVVTHEDDPKENIWFERVADVARDYGIPTITPADPNAPEMLTRLRTIDADFLFSFYYRLMLKPSVLETVKRGAYNMHGSLLPKYRGRAPVNWAIIHGERETGATLHRMVEKPDAGELVAQQAVPILPDDTAREVFDKVTLAAEMALHNILPQLVVGNAPHVMADLKQGSYFGGRKPEDGRIDWTKPAQEIHNLVRALTPPYPGAFCDVAGHRLRLLRTLNVSGHRSAGEQPGLYLEEDHLFASCGDGGVVKILSLELDGTPIALASLPGRLGLNPISLV